MPNPSMLRPLTPSQRDVLDTLRRLAAGEPSVTAGATKLAAEAGLTAKQTNLGLDGLVASNILTKQWNPDKYAWTYTFTNVKTA